MKYLDSNKIFLLFKKVKFKDITKKINHKVKYKIFMKLHIIFCLQNPIYMLNNIQKL